MVDATDWHRMEVDDAAGLLGSSPRGLPQSVARQRLEQYGPNLIVEQARRTVWRMVLDQFADFLILVLIAAAVVAGLVGEPQDTILIGLIVVLNAIFGAVQDYRAEQAIAALRRLAAPHANVLRDGIAHLVSAETLVPGDVVVLAAGDAVPADLRLLEAADLEIDESLLTGESAPVLKTTIVTPSTHQSLSDRTNLGFKGTLVTRGRGLGLVVATGMSTELGRIADMLHAAGLAPTPLQRRLSVFSRRLAVAVLGICAVVFVLGVLRGEPAMLMFLTAVSLAVAAVPEALPAVVTISLAIGAGKMTGKNVLIRRLPAVETLGSVTVICSDKTGTLTENRMRMEQLIVGATPFGQLSQVPACERRIFGHVLALSNDVRIGGEDGPAGEPTELALFEAAAAAGFDKTRLEVEYPRIGELAFDSNRKRMSTLHQTDDGVLLICKGAPEAVLPCCESDLSQQSFDRDARLGQAERLAAQGFRVLALATKRLTAAPDRVDLALEGELSFLGFAGLIDPPRPGVEAAVAECIGAGIVPVMITGDHPGTAQAIAIRLGLTNDGDRLLTGPEIDRMSDADFEREVERVRVYARVTPAQKIRIVQSLQARGHFVAMTGDGVNDAPALKLADIGVAMGKKGTDVAREAADMVLLDDNFTTIVTAVREGRRIYDNIRKFIKDTMSSNSGEIWTLLLAPLFGLPIPLQPIHILWINLVTDGLPGLAFTAEPAERGVMQRRPRPPNESIFAQGMWQHIVWYGLFVGGVAIASQAWAYGRGVEYWQTVIFTVLTISQLFHSMSVRSEKEAIWTIGVFTNPAMLAAVLVTVALQLMIIYVPVLNPIFHTHPLPLFDLAICFALSALTMVAVEIEKWAFRHGLIYRHSARS